MTDTTELARFRRDLIALTQEEPTRERPLAVAVSGGPDSMALLALAAVAFPRAVIAAKVDHGLREAAAQEARMVAAQAQGLAASIAAGEASIMALDADAF